MASIVRIKRRLEDEPAEALLLAPSSKKLKEDVSVDQKVLKFFGTIDSKVRDVKTINKLLEDKKMKSYRDKPAPSERNISKAQASHPLGNRYTVRAAYFFFSTLDNVRCSNSFLLDHKHISKPKWRRIRK